MKDQDQDEDRRAHVGRVCNGRQTSNVIRHDLTFDEIGFPHRPGRAAWSSMWASLGYVSGWLRRVSRFRALGMAAPSAVLLKMHQTGAVRLQVWSLAARDSRKEVS